MTYDSVLRYTDESVKQCKELAAFLRKRQAVEADYAKALLKISQKEKASAAMSTLSPSFYRSPTTSLTNLNTTANDKQDPFRSQLGKSSLWRGYNDLIEESNKLAEAHQEMANSLLVEVIEPFVNYIREMEAVRKTQIDKGQEFLKSLQEAFNGLKKARKEFEGLQSTTNDAIHSHIRAQQNPGTKDRELEKLTTKMQSAMEKAKRAEDTQKYWEDVCSSAKDDYYGTFLPGLYEDIRVKEEERCIAVKRVMRDYINLQKAHTGTYHRVMEFLSDKIAKIDISEDSEEFVANHISEEQRATPDIPAKSLVNSIVSGRMNLKRGDLVNGWKTKYFVLALDKQLYIYDSEDSLRPREVISLRTSSVSSIDDSFFGRPNCLQLINMTQSGRQVYNLCCDTESIRDAWLNKLREYVYCCQRCAVTYNYSADVGGNVSLIDRVNGFRFIKSLEVSVVEAKELTLSAGMTPVGSKGLMPFCVIMLDDVKHARTGLKNGDAPFWGETFMLDDFRPHHSRVRLLVFHQSRNQRDVDLGYITVHLDQLRIGTKVEEWYRIKPIPKSGADENIPCGSIRVALTLKEEHLLPEVQYEQFLYLVSDRSLFAVKHLGRLVVAQRDALARSTLRVFTTLDKEIEAICSLVDHDIASTDDANILFRGNSLGTKILDNYMKQIGLPYLHATVGGVLRNIIKAPESCEVDPLRVESAEVGKVNAKRLIGYVVQIWDSIMKSVEQCPSELVEIFSHISSSVQSRWPSAENTRFTGISGFIFLRFFCPAILSPKLFKITNDLPSSVCVRNLTLVAKIMQNLANLTEFGQKEPYMAQFNPFIQAQVANMKVFIELVSSRGERHPTTPKPSFDSRRELEGLYLLFAQHLPDLSNSVAGSGDREAVNQIIAITKELQMMHRSEGDEKTLDSSRTYPLGSPLRNMNVTPVAGIAPSPRFERPGMLQQSSNYIEPVLGGVGSGITMNALGERNERSGSGHSSPPSSVNSPIISSLPPKIELNLETTSPIGVSAPMSALSAGSPGSVSPVAYRKHRDISVYDINNGLGEGSSLESLQHILNSIAGGEGGVGGADTSGRTADDVPQWLAAAAASIDSNKRTGGGNSSAPSSPRSVRNLYVAPIGGGMTPTWLSEANIAGFDDGRDATLSPPRQTASSTTGQTQTSSQVSPTRARVPPRASSATDWTNHSNGDGSAPGGAGNHSPTSVNRNAMLYHRPGTAQQHQQSSPQQQLYHQTSNSAISNNIPTSVINANSTPSSTNISPASSITNLYRSTSHIPGATASSPPSHDRPVAASLPNRDVVTASSSPASGFNASSPSSFNGAGGAAQDDDGFSDHSSVRSIESYKSDASRDTTNSNAFRSASSSTGARIKHRFSLLMHGSKDAGGGDKGSSTSRGGKR